MTRPARTTHEMFAIESLRGLLENKGYDLTDDHSITDAPDWSFSLNNEKIACECSLLSLEKVMRWSHKKRVFERDKIYQIKIPNEPHLWLAQILAKKSPKVPRYKASSNSTKAWLVVHTEAPPMYPLFKGNESTRKMLAFAASNLEHNFDQIWLVHSESGASRVWKSGDEKIHDPGLDLSHGYPQYVVRFIGLTIKKSKENIIDLATSPVAESIQLQPLDTRFQII